MVVTWPQGTDLHLISHCCQPSLDLTLQTKTSLLLEDFRGWNPSNQLNPCWLVYFCNCQILSRGDHAIPMASLDSNFSSSLLGRFGTGAQKRFLSSVTSPQPACLLYIYTLIFPFQSLCYKYPHHPQPPGPSPGLFRMRSSIVNDLRVTCPFGSQTWPPQAFLPGLGVTSECGWPGCSPFPKLIPGGREEGFWSLHFFTPICF